MANHEVFDPPDEAKVAVARVLVVDTGYAVVPAEDIEELRTHYAWGDEGSQTVEHLGEALRRIGAVLRSDLWR